MKFCGATKEAKPLWQNNIIVHGTVGRADSINE